jgi:hypothetical protein
LGAALGLNDEYLVLLLDLLFAAGLLARVGPVFQVTARYERWRAATPARQWAELTWTWLWLPHSPITHREPAATKIHSPRPRAARWAVLRAARGGSSVNGIAAAAHWFCPLVHEHADVVVREAQVLGVVAGDALSACGEALLSADDEQALTAAVAGVVVPMPCEVEVLEDLTAVVFGQLTVDARRVLEASAESRVEDGAQVWRFTAASVRAAFAQGWTAESLLVELNELTRQDVPWALRVLLGEQGRGQVRVSEVECCVIAEAEVVAEVVRLPGFIELAPTVAGSAMASAEVVAQLLAEGFAVIEDPSSGNVAVRQRKPRTVEPVQEPVPVDLSDLAEGEPSTAQAVRGLNKELTDEAVALLAEAIDEQSDVRIDYVKKEGQFSQRTITPTRSDGQYLVAWCHLRDEERQFKVSRIKAVSPVHP